MLLYETSRIYSVTVIVEKERAFQLLKKKEFELIYICIYILFSYCSQSHDWPDKSYFLLVLCCLWQLCFSFWEKSLDITQSKPVKSSFCNRNFDILWHKVSFTTFCTRQLFLSSLWLWKDRIQLRIISWLTMILTKLLNRNKTDTVMKCWK